jgi:hypothetical protein
MEETPMANYEVHIELSDGNLAVMLKTRDKGEAESYADQLRSNGKYRRNLIRVMEFVNEGRGVSRVAEMMKQMIESEEA